MNAEKIFLDFESPDGQVAGELLGAEIDSNSEKAKALYGELQTAYETREEKKTVIADLVPHGDKWSR